MASGFNVATCLHILISLLNTSCGNPIPQYHRPRARFEQSSNIGMHRVGISTGTHPNGHNDALFAYAGSNWKDGVRYGLGLLDHSAMANENFGVKEKVLVFGAELDATNGKLGSMARVTVYEAGLRAGPLDVNIGVNVDTGARWDRGLEVKFLGMGGKITDRGIEGCFIVCLGFSW